MKKELVGRLLELHPSLTEFDPKYDPTSPNPLFFLEIIPDSFGKKLIEKSDKKKLPKTEKALKIKTTYTPHYDKSCWYDPEHHEIEVTNHNYDKFLIALGTFAWKHFLNADGRAKYAKLVGAVDQNHLFKTGKKETAPPENSTWLHFARNFLNLTMLRPLEFVEHKPGHTTKLLEFFVENSFTDEIHCALFNEKLGKKRAYEAETTEKIKELLEYNKIKKVDAIDVREYIKQYIK
jgi:hypothetical protein